MNAFETEEEALARLHADKLWVYMVSVLTNTDRTSEEVSENYQSSAHRLAAQLATANGGWVRKARVISAK